MTSILLWLLGPAPANAAMMRHHDLTSLALDSDAIVLARVVGLREHGWSELRDHEIVEVYAGALAPGDRVELDYGALRLTPPWTDPREVPPPDDEVVMFLARNDEGNWRLLGSGLRIFVDDLTFRFEQFDNPGPYAPVVQGHDPHDVFGDPRGGPGLGREQFEVELLAAIERANGIRAALTAVDSAEGRARSLELIGPVWGLDDDEPCRIHDFSFFEDRARGRILEALAASGDVEATLEGLSRVCGGVDPSRLRLGLEAPRLLALAAEVERPVHHRVAALELVENDIWARDDERVSAALIALLADPEPRVRAAAAAISMRDEGASERWRAAIVERLRVERDARARFELLLVGHEHELLGAPGLPDLREPIITAVRRGRNFEVRWANLAPRWLLEDLTIELHPTQGQPRTLHFERQELGWWISGIAQGVTGWLLIDEALPDGPIRIEVVARLDDDGRIREARAPMRPFGVAPEPWTVEPELVPAPAPAPEPAPTPTPSGCACGVEQPPVFGGLVLIGLFGLALQRRLAAR